MAKQMQPQWAMTNGPQASSTAGLGQPDNGLIEDAIGNGPGAFKALGQVAHATGAHGRQADIAVVAHGPKQGLDQV